MMEVSDDFFEVTVATSDEQTPAERSKADFSTLCRICAGSNEYLIPIFEGEGVQLDLRQKIEKYLPVKINSTDELPTSMCYQCASSILNWHELVENCVEADKQLKCIKNVKEEASDITELWEEDSPDCDSSSNVKSASISSKESCSKLGEDSISPSPVSLPKFTASSSTLSLPDIKKEFLNDVNMTDIKSSKELSSEKSSECAKVQDKGSKVKRTKKLTDRDLMASLIPDVKLVEEVEEVQAKPVLGKRKRQRSSYFSYDDFIYNALNKSKAESSRDNSNVKKSKHTSKEKTSRDNSSEIKAKKTFKEKSSRDNSSEKKSKQTSKDKTKDSSTVESKMSDKSFRCSYCPAYYTRKNDARRHERKKHPAELRKADQKKKTDKEVQDKPPQTSAVAKIFKADPEDYILSCDLCQSEFKNKLELIKHLRDDHSDLFQFDDDVLKPNNLDKSRSKRYLCNICSTFLRGRKSYLSHHRLEHPGEKLDFIRELPKQQFHCEFCSSGFTRYHDLFRHLKKKHLEFIVILETKRVLRKRIVCLLCQEEFSQNEDATLHLKTDHKVADNQIMLHMRWACSQCEERFETVGSLVTHGNEMHSIGSGEDRKSEFTTFQGVRTTHEKKLSPATCDVCGLTFKQRYQLMTHKSRHITLEDRVKYEPVVHACRVLINNEPNFRCSRCSRMFAKEDPFIRHMLLHDTGRAYCCHMCGYQCFTQAHLNRHLNIVHFKKRDFKCDICGHAFAEKQAMIDHRRTHTGERPCQCKICGKMFPSWTCVYTHKRSHTDYFPHACTEPGCKSKFRTKYRLTEHMRRHTGERPFACPIASCDKTFHDKRAISRHLTVHTNARPFECTLCPRSYKHKKYLSFHMKTNHGVKMSELNEQGATDPALILT